VQAHRTDTVRRADEALSLEDAIKRLSALARDSRLEVFHLLVAVGEVGLAAGEIARRLDVPANTLSAQLLTLSNAKLVKAKREGRSIIYSANFETMRDLLIFLVADCCDGHPGICGPLVNSTRQSFRKSAKSKFARSTPRQQRH